MGAPGPWRAGGTWRALGAPRRALSEPPKRKAGHRAVSPARRRSSWSNGFKLKALEADPFSPSHGAPERRAGHRAKALEAERTPSHSTNSNSTNSNSRKALDQPRGGAHVPLPWPAICPARVPRDEMLRDTSITAYCLSGCTTAASLTLLSPRTVPPHPSPPPVRNRLAISKHYASPPRTPPRSGRPGVGRPSSPGRPSPGRPSEGAGRRGESMREAPRDFVGPCESPGTPSSVGSCMTF